MLQWLSAILATLAVGGLATWLAQGPLRRRDETAAGIAALSALSWREFTGIVLEALSKRGYQRVDDRGNPSGDADYTLVRDGEHWLLSAKHGSAYVLGRPSVNELAAAMSLAGAVGGLLVTQGAIDDDGRAAAKGRPIELLDGPVLWPWLRPLLPGSVVSPIVASAAKHARQRSLAGWLLALLVGVGVFSLGFLSPSAPATATPSPPAAAAAMDAPAGQAATDGTDDAAAPEQEAPGAAPDANPDAATLEAQRRELASTVATLPMVLRAIWTSSSTLEVFLDDTSDDPVAAICPLVERYPALASSRIQLTPPADSGKPVRFRQCRSY